jgi:nucleoside-diphosphate-sugar epimerase
MHCDALIATPVNLGSSELVSIDELVAKVEHIAGVKLERQYDRSAPTGVAGRNSDNTFIRQVLDWEPCTTLDTGLAATYTWIQTQYRARHPQNNAVHAGVT